MDSKVKSLLDEVCQTQENEEKNRLLRLVLQIFHEIDNSQFSSDLPESVSSDMYIRCAQLAIDIGNNDLASQNIALYFTKAPAADLQKCNAYLCLAKLSAPTSNTDLPNLKEAGENILRAIKMALKIPVLAGKVYEASILFWRFCYFFLRPGYYDYVAEILAKIVDALIEINDANSNWRAFLSIMLVKCYLKSKQKSLAIATVTKVSAFIKEYAPSQYRKLVYLIVKHELKDPAFIQSEINSSVELSVFYNICQIEEDLENNEGKKDYENEIKALLIALQVPISNQLEDDCSVEKKQTNTQSSKAVLKSPVQKLATKSPNRPHFLLELAHLSLKVDLGDFAQRCIHAAKMSTSDNTFRIQLEFVSSELLVHSLGSKKETYGKKAIQTRLTAIKDCHDNLVKAIRQNDNPSIQVGCITIWNLSLPLLMWNLRSNLHKPLTLVAQALEDIQCLLTQLRCQVHLELALCEEENDHIRMATKHLHKAIALDDSGMYVEKIKRKLRRLTLRSELYKQPKRDEDIAAMIIEQASTANNTGSGEKKRALFLKAGLALAPRTFNLVLDSEKLFYDTHIKLMPRNSKQLALCVHHYNANISKSESHLRRVGNQSDSIEQLHLWADLAKIARKQEVWDICRTATQFCLLYDNDQWLAWREKDKAISSKSVDAQGKTDEPTNEKKLSDIEFEKTSLAERERVRLLAEINFIRGEALIQLLRKENVELNDEPVFPMEISKRSKNYSCVSPSDDKNWKIYTEWVSQLNSKITACFLRGLDHGISLEETWLVGNAAVYLWNYNTHIIRQSRYSEITETLNSILEGFKKVGYKGFEQLLINICTSLAYGFITPWMPAPVDETESLPTSSAKGKPVKVVSKQLIVPIAPEATPHLKKAIDVCEFAMKIINNKETKKLISQSSKMSLLKVWVISKQMAQQQIGKIWCKGEDSSVDDEKLITQIIVYLEMHSLTKNGVLEFKDLPSLSDIVSMMEKCSWNDNLVKLQLLTCLAYLLFNQKMHDRIIHIVQPVTNAYLQVLSSDENSKTKVTPVFIPSESEKVSHLFLVMGQSLLESNDQQPVSPLEIMDSFLNAAKFAGFASNYELVITAAHYFWNIISPFSNIRSQRKNLKNPLKQILADISKVANKCQAEQAKKQCIVNTPSPIKVPQITIYGPIGNFIDNEIILDKNEDLILRVSLYNLLVQCYADQEKWEKGLKVLDTAIAELPSPHKMQLFRQRVLTKSRLGINMLLDIQKFRVYKEDVVSRLWRDVALNSRQLSDQLIAYQRAIEMLVSDKYKWQKVDYLLEFGQWLYTHQFPMEDVFDVMEWAVDILMGMQFELPCIESPSSSPKNVNDRQKTEENKKDEKISPFKPTQSDFSEEIDDANLIDYVPQEQEILIGAETLHTNLDVKNLNSIKQLDYLIKCHVLLSEVHSQSSEFFYRYSLLAWDFVNQIWHLTFSSASAILLNVFPKETPHLTKHQEKSKEKGRGKKEKASDVNGSPKDKHKKKSMHFLMLPRTPEEWATFEFSDEFLEALKHDNLKYCSINKTCFENAWLSVHYLIRLVCNLKRIGLPHLALPAIALCRIIATIILESKSVILLTHCKNVKICSELNIKNGNTLHENAVTQMLQNEIPEMIKMKEKAKRYIYENKTPDDTEETPYFSELDRQKLTEAKLHLGVNLKNGVYYRIWTDIAEELIEQSRYQKAREFLTKSYKFADIFKDEICKVRISYLIARLAFFEVQYKATFNFCMEIQKNHCHNEYIWYRTVSLLCKVVTQPDFVNDYQLSQKILVNAIEEFDKCATMRVNQAAHLKFFSAKLQAKLTETKAKAFLKRIEFLSAEEVIDEYCVSFYNDFQTSIEFLIKHNLKLNAVKVIETQADIWHKIAIKLKTNEDLQQKYYIECFELLKTAISETQSILYRIIAITPIDWKINLLIKRRFANIQLKYSEVLVEVEALHLEKEIEKRKENEKKDLILKTVEELTAETPIFFFHKKNWHASKCWIADEILSQATCAHHMTRDIHSLCSKSLMIIGHCLMQLSLCYHPDAPKNWLIAEMNLTHLGTENGQSGRESTQQKNDQQNSLFADSSHISSKNKTILKSHKFSLSFLFQASECFLQSLDLACEHKFIDVATSASLGLVNLIGQYDNTVTTQLLALYQSCCASTYMQNLLEQSQNNPRHNRLAALLHQHKHLLKYDLKYNFSHSHFFGSLTHCLETDWQAWKRCQINPNHLSLQKEFPSNFYFVILQHSPDKDFLYASFMDKNRSTKGSVNSKQHSGTSSSPTASTQRSANFGCPVDKNDLLKLLEMAHNLKQESKNNYIRRSVQQKHRTQCSNMLENLKHFVKADETTCWPIFDVHDWIQKNFVNLVNAMENYLAPILEPLSAALQTVYSTQHHNKEQREFLVVLADTDLLELPLEALTNFRKLVEIVSLSRGISLQMFHYRLQHEPIPEESKEPKKKEKKTHEMPSHLNPAAAKAPTKKGKVATLDRTLPLWAQPIDTNSFKYIVDPFDECHEESHYNPIQLFKKMILQYEQYFTSRWLGLFGSEHIVSSGEWEVYLNNSGSFIFYGPTKLTTHLKPSKLSAFNLTKCMLVYQLDLNENYLSFDRQSHQNVSNTKQNLLLESPLHTALLLSLAGVRCIVGNQWTPSLKENADQLQSSMKYLLGEGLSTGETLHHIQTPYINREKQEETTTDDGKRNPSPSKKNSTKKKGEKMVKNTDIQEPVSAKNLTVEKQMSSMPIADLHYEWFNLVCYGLPNLIVTQIN